jgi:hypothetical protein
MTPPSWFAATKNPTLAVVFDVARDWTASVTARIAVAPTVVVTMNVTDPKWYRRICPASLELSRSF